MFGNWSEIFSLISYDEISNFDISMRKVYVKDPVECEAIKIVYLPVCRAT